MRTLIRRWQTLSDVEIESISARILGVHWLMMGFAMLGWALLPLLLGISPELLLTRLW